MHSMISRRATQMASTTMITRRIVRSEQAFEYTTALFTASKLKHIYLEPFALIQRNIGDRGEKGSDGDVLKDVRFGHDRVDGLVKIEHPNERRFVPAQMREVVRLMQLDDHRTRRRRSQVMNGIERLQADQNVVQGDIIAAIQIEFLGCLRAVVYLHVVMGLQSAFN